MTEGGNLQLRRGDRGGAGGALVLPAGTPYWFKDIAHMAVHDGATPGGVLLSGAAVVSASAPSDTYPGQVWIDTSTSVSLKVRNAADNAWLTLALFESAINVQGGISFAGALTSATAAAGAIWTNFNVTASDADGGRLCRLVFGGNKLPAASHYLASMDAEHDGAGADELARVRFLLNGGSDGFAPASVPLILRATGPEVPDAAWPIGLDRRLETEAASAQTLSTSSTILQWSAAAVIDAGFAQRDTGNSSAQMSNVGRYEARCAVTLDVSTSTSNIWGEATVWLEHYDGSTWTELARSRRRQQLRRQSSQSEATSFETSAVFTTSNANDKLRVQVQLTNSPAGFGCQTEASTTTLSVRRLAP